MRYYKDIKNGFIIAIGQGLGGTEIAKQEYCDILKIIYKKKQAPQGYAYMLNINLNWELVEIPKEEII